MMFVSVRRMWYDGTGEMFKRGGSMQIIMGVRNFGKIEYAEVDIDGFSVFVGNNNSGKTYLMQLIYGVRTRLRKYAKDFESIYLDRIRKAAENKRVILDADTAKDLEAFVNEVLKKNKEKIVQEIFHESLSIEQLYIRLLFEKDEKLEYLLWHKEDKEKILREIEKNLHMSQEERREIIEDLGGLQLGGDHLTVVSLTNYILHGEKETRGVSISISAEEQKLFQKAVNECLDLITDRFSTILFVPASRTGLLMLYKEFFAHKADEAVQIVGTGEVKDSEAVNMGLTQPVYEFIRFIQTFQTDRRTMEKNEKLIQFMEDHLLEGKVYQGQGNQSFYQSREVDQAIPLYLSSSMINELTPAFYALQSTRQKDFLIWDEIETSLHPQKQMELVRLLSRMNNHGIRLIVSTHSDAMATKINNLCMLSYSESLKSRRWELLEKVGLEPEDLLQKKIHIYQFTNEDHGKSHVTELLYNEFTGYEFTQFNDSVEKLFKETKLIME